MNISGVGSVPLLPFRVVLRYVGTGLLGWVLAAAFFLYSLPDLAAGNYQSATILALVHLVVLGWALMLAQGAMYQLIPVAFQVGIRHGKLASFNYWIYLIGVAGLVASFPGFSISGLRIFGGLTVLSVLLFAFNIVRSLLPVKQRGPMFGFVVSSILYLAITVLLGISQVVIMGSGMGAKHFSAIFTIHIWAGLIGWFTMLIIGFTYKLFPMFTLSHGFSEKRQGLILVLFHAAIVLTAVGAWVESQACLTAGLTVLLAGVILFGVDVAGIYRHRMRGKPEPPMAMATVAIGWLALVVTILLMMRWLGLSITDRGITALGFLFFVAWLSQTIVGYLYKIAPFLVWNDRYADKVGRQPVPLLKEMVNEKLTRWVAIMYNAGLVLAVSGIAFDLAGAVYAGIGLLAVAVLAFVGQMAMVIIPNKQFDTGGNPNGNGNGTASA